MTKTQDALPGSEGIELDGELLLEFVEEAREQLDGAEEALLILERVPEERKPLDAARRSLHSLKGSAGYVSMFDIQALCHAAEELLGRLDADAAPRARQRIDLALEAVSLARARLAEVERCVQHAGELGSSAPIAAFLRTLDATSPP